MKENKSFWEKLIYIFINIFYSMGIAYFLMISIGEHYFENKTLFIGITGLIISYIIDICDYVKEILSDK